LGDVLSNNSKNPRLEMLRSFAAKQPNDPFPRYGLAMELKTSGDSEGAWREFEVLIADHADYIATYAPAGEVLTGQGRVAEARVVYGKGIEACNRRNDAHTRDHLEAALDALGTDN